MPFVRTLLIVFYYGVLSAEPPALRALTTAAEVHALSVKEAGRSYPVSMHGVVTYVDEPGKELFVQDETAGVFVFLGHMKANRPPQVGQRLRIDGVSTPADFAPAITNGVIEVLGPGKLPSPKALQFDHLLAAREDCRWVQMEGVIRSAEIRRGTLSMNISTQGGTILGLTTKFPPDWERRIVDARVTVDGVLTAIFNKQRQSIGIRVLIPDFSFIRIDDPPPADAFALPLTHAVTVGQFQPGSQLDRRIHIRATVTGIESGAIYVADGEGNLAIQAMQAVSARPGELVDIVGFPGAVLGRLGLQDAAYRPAGSGALVPTPLVTPAQIMPEAIYTAMGGYALQAGMKFDLKPIRIEGILLQSSVSSDMETLVMQDGKSEFSANLQGAGLKALPKPEDGSRLRLTGVCLITYDQYRRAQSFRVLLRDRNDIVVVARPASWNLRVALWSLGLVAIFFVGAVAWVSVLRKQVSRQTRELTLANASLRSLSTRDALTGVANRRKFDEILEAEFELAAHFGKPLSMVMVDLDYFKSLNDFCGHQHGDRCLTRVAGALESAVKHGVDLVARYGGEEFAVVLPGVDRSEALAIAERLRLAVERLEISHPASPASRYMSISAGLATFEPGRNCSPESLTDTADKALYRAKERGRNRVVSDQPDVELIGSDILQCTNTIPR